MYHDIEGLKAEAMEKLMGPGVAVPSVKRVKRKKQLIRYIEGNSDDSHCA